VGEIRGLCVITMDKSEIEIFLKKKKKRIRSETHKKTFQTHILTFFSLRIRSSAHIIPFFQKFEK